MKKVLMGSAFLAVIGIGITATQLSCSKSTAQSTTNYTLPPATTSTLGGVIVGSGLTISSNGTLSANASTGGLQKLNKIIFLKLVTGGGAKEIWMMDYDGNNKTKVNIVMPAGEEINYDAPKLSPDGTKIIFLGKTTASTNNDDDIYICNLDGSGVTKIYDMPVGTGHTLIGGAY